MAEVELGEQGFMPSEQQRQRSWHLCPIMESREPMLMNTLPLTIVITLGLLTLKYHDHPGDVFVGNVVPLGCFIASTVVYGIIVDIMKKSSLNSAGDCSFALHFAAVASGLISMLSQMSLVFLSYPNSLVPLLIFTPVPIILITWLICCYYESIWSGITSLVRKIRCTGANETQDVGHKEEDVEDETEDVFSPV